MASVQADCSCKFPFKYNEDDGTVHEYS